MEEEYTTKDGKFLSDKLIQDILFSKNKSKYIQSAVKQGITGALKWQLAKEKNFQSGMQRTYSTAEPSEVDNLRKQLFGK